MEKYVLNQQSWDYLLTRGINVTQPTTQGNAKISDVEKACIEQLKKANLLINGELTQQGEVLYNAVHNAESVTRVVNTMRSDVGQITYYKTNNGYCATAVDLYTAKYLVLEGLSLQDVVDNYMANFASATYCADQPITLSYLQLFSLLLIIKCFDFAKIAKKQYVTLNDMFNASFSTLNYAKNFCVPTKVWLSYKNLMNEKAEWKEACTQLVEMNLLEYHNGKNNRYVLTPRARILDDNTLMGKVTVENNQVKIYRICNQAVWLQTVVDDKVVLTPVEQAQDCLPF